jgi:hypothetical protein
LISSGVAVSQRQRLGGTELRSDVSASLYGVGLIHPRTPLVKIK